MKRYEQFPHTADIGVRVYGKSLKDLFGNAAFAMFDILADLEGITNDLTETFDLKANNSEELLIAWLDELLYRFYTKQVILSEFNIGELNGKSLKATAYGRSAKVNRNRLKTEIKAATYADLAIKKIVDGYSVEIIFDV